jgi:hypothetical protein
MAIAGVAAFYLCGEVTIAELLQWLWCVEF